MPLIPQPPRSWLEAGFTWETTADGSPTLRVHKTDHANDSSATGSGGESMHHSGGAFSETDLIYGSVVRDVFALPIEQPTILSVGLGLGYVEFFIAAASIKSKKKFRLISLEPVEPLVSAMLMWIQEKLPPGEIQAGLDEVAGWVSQHEGIFVQDLRRCLLEAWQSHHWAVGGALLHTKLPDEQFHGILYDVFAAKTYPDLWTQTHLENFFKNCAATSCLFSTFACTGALKRALKANDFEVIKRQGFKGSRNSTLGRR